MDEDQFQSLTSKIDELITIVNDVNKENQLLKATYDSCQLNVKNCLLKTKKPRLSSSQFLAD